jgi:hypothetical protein
VIHEDLPLHDLRPEVFSNPNPYGLDKTGFTAVKHNSAFHSAPYSKESFMDEKLVEEVYIPETENLVKQVTGAKTIFTVRPHTQPSFYPQHTISPQTPSYLTNNPPD